MATRSRPKSPCPKCGRRYKNLAQHMRRSQCGNHDVTVLHPVKDQELPPGTIIGVGSGSPRKIPMTREWMEAHLPKVMIMNPPFSSPVTFQGVIYHINAGVDVEVPGPIAALYSDYARNRNLPNIQLRGTVQERALRVGTVGYGLLEPDVEEP